MKGKKISFQNGADKIKKELIKEYRREIKKERIKIMNITKNKVLTKEERIKEIIKKLDKEGKVIAGINDSIFKSLFMEEEAKGFQHI